MDKERTVRKNGKKRKWYNDLYFTFILLSITFYTLMLFVRIGDRTLSSDEAITAMLGKNIKRFFLPKVWDGINLVTTSTNGNEFSDSLIYIKHNWLPYYYAAFCQLFGDNILFMRLGFAIIGLIGYLGYIFLVKEIFQNRERKQIVALIIYILSIPILLFNRTIYYCAPALSFTILSVLFFLRCMRDNKKKDWFLLTISIIMLFHSFFLFSFITIISLFITYFFLGRNKKKDKYLAITLVVCSLFCAPWYLYRAFHLSQVTVTPFVGIPYFLDLLMGYLWMIQAYFFPYLVLMPLFICYKIRERVSRRNSERNNPDGIYKEYPKKDKKINAVWFFIFLQILLNLIVICIFGLCLNTRWLITSIPFFYIIIAEIIDGFFSKSRFVALVILGAVSLTNILHVMPYSLIKIIYDDYPSIQKIVKSPVPYFNTEELLLTNQSNLVEYLGNICYRSYLLDFYREITNDYGGAEKAMVEFLLENASIGEKVYLLGYQHETVIYYTGLQMVNRLESNEKLFSPYNSFPNARQFQYLTVCPVQYCDWIVERVPTGKDEIWHDKSLFEEYYIPCSEWGESNEIWAHTFYKSNNTEGFYIYRNRKK